MARQSLQPGPLQLGLDTFGDVSTLPGGSLTPYDQVIRQVVDQGVLADQVGVDAFGIGEHHRDDFAVSAPDMLLAAIAARTDRILLGSAVTVLARTIRSAFMNALQRWTASRTVGPR